MDNTNVSGSVSKVPYKFENLIDEARSLSETGIFDVVIFDVVKSVDESGDSKFSVTKRKRLTVNLHAANEVDEMISNLDRFQVEHQKSFILRYLCNLSVNEVAERLGTTSEKVVFGLEHIGNNY